MDLLGLDMGKPSLPAGCAVVTMGSLGFFRGWPLRFLISLLLVLYLSAVRPLEGRVCRRVCWTSRGQVVGVLGGSLIRHREGEVGSESGWYASVPVR